MRDDDGDVLERRFTGYPGNGLEEAPVVVASDALLEVLEAVPLAFIHGRDFSTELLVRRGVSPNTMPDVRRSPLSPALANAIRAAQASLEPDALQRLGAALQALPDAEQTPHARALVTLALRGHRGELAPSTPRPTDRGALQFLEIGAAMPGGVAVLDHLPDMGDGRAHARLTLLDVHHGDGLVAIDLVLPDGDAPLQAYALDMGGWVFVPTDPDMIGRLTRAAILAMS